MKTVLQRIFLIFTAVLLAAAAFPIRGYAEEADGSIGADEPAPEILEYLQPGEYVADIITGDGWLYVMTVDPESGRIVRLFDTVENKYELMSSIGTDEPAQEIFNDLEPGVYILDAEKADDRFYVLAGDMNGRWQIRIYKQIDDRWQPETRSGWLEKMFGVFPDIYSQGVSGEQLMIDFIDEASAVFIRLPGNQWVLSEWYSFCGEEMMLAYYPDVMNIEYKQTVYDRKDERIIRICGAYAEARKIENITTQMMPQSLKDVNLYPQTGEYDAIAASDSNEYIQIYSGYEGKLKDHDSFTVYQGTPVKVLGEEAEGIIRAALGGMTGYIWSEDVYPSPNGVLFEVNMNPTRSWDVTDDTSLSQQMTLYSEPSVSSTVIWSHSECSGKNLNMQIIGESEDWFAVLTTLGPGFIERKYFRDGNG